MPPILPSGLSGTLEGDNTSYPTTDGGSVNIGEDCAPSNVNDALRNVAAMQAASWGGMYSGSTRPGQVQSGSLWRDTSGGATANVLKYYDGTDDIAVCTINTTANTVSFTGNLTGDVTGALTGNAATATALNNTALASAGISDLVGIASQAEAEAGTNTDKAMTPLRVQQAIDQNAAGSFGPRTAAALGGTENNFLSIPSGLNRIVVAWYGVSTDGTSDLLLQLGDSGGIETSGYTGASHEPGVSGASFSAGFQLTQTIDAAREVWGQANLVRVGTNQWHCSGTSTISTPRSTIFAGVKTLTATLDKVRLTTVNGTDTFDAGSWNILYEGAT